MSRERELGRTSGPKLKKAALPVASDRSLGYIVPTTFMKMPWLLNLKSVRSSEKLVKL